jgi:hypothetical protein
MMPTLISGGGSRRRRMAPLNRTPNRCLSSTHSAQAGFLDAGLAQLQPREGYRFRFEAGPAPSLSDSSLNGASHSIGCVL